MATKSLKSRIEAAAALKRMAAEANNETAAMAAIEQFHAYMKKHGLSLDDIEGNGDANASHNWAKSGGVQDRDPDGTHYNYSAPNGGMHMVDQFVTMHIATYYNCRVWIERDDLNSTIVIWFGHEVDRQAAMELRRVCRRAMNYEWKAHTDYHGVGNATIMKSFHMGMGERLRKRMEFFYRADASTKGGTDLIVAKDRRTEEEFTKLGMHLRTRHGRAFTVDNAAFAAGQRAGNRVDFGRGIGTKTLRIGK